MDGRMESGLRQAVRTAVFALITMTFVIVLCILLLEGSKSSEIYVDMDIASVLGAVAVRFLTVVPVIVLMFLYGYHSDDGKGQWFLIAAYASMIAMVLVMAGGFGFTSYDTGMGESAFEMESISVKLDLTPFGLMISAVPALSIIKVLMGMRYDAKQ